jgi:hypothetical protein
MPPREKEKQKPNSDGPLGAGVGGLGPVLFSARQASPFL